MFYAWILVVGNRVRKREIVYVLLAVTMMVHPVLTAANVAWEFRSMIKGKKNNVAQHTSYESQKPFNIVGLESMGRELKRVISSVDNFLTFKMLDVEEGDRKIGDVSKGAARMRWLFNNVGMKSTKRIAELGVGRGGWMQALDEYIEKENYTGYSLWAQQGQEKLFYKTKGGAYIQSDFRAIRAQPCETLLCDAGENLDLYDDEIRRSIDMLKAVNGWMKYRPEQFAIRIPNPFNKEVMAFLDYWKQQLGTGHLVRHPMERNSVLTMYFVHGEGDMRNEMSKLASLIFERTSRAEDMTVTREPAKKTGIRPYWPETGNLPEGVESLKMLDMKDTIAAHGDMRAPINTTHFMKEIGWYPSTFKGNTSTHENSTVNGIIHQIKPILRSYGLWKITSTTPEATWKTVLKKVDKAPVENHNHYARMWEAYKAVVDFMKERGSKLRRLRTEEIMAGVNRDGAMGWQEKHLGYSNMGEYIDQPEVWKRNVSTFRDCLLRGKPIKGDYNSIGKKERKQGESSRLIWFLCATARILETEIFGHIDTMIKCLPQSVSGLPLYDYGEALKEVMTEGRAAVCDDVAGWDTRVSHGLLSLEHAAIQRMLEGTDDTNLADEVRAMYRLYAYPMVKIARPSPSGVQDVLYQLQGQVASGRRVTYPFNTITNMCLTMSRAAYSQNIPVEAMYAWALKSLRRGHSNQYGGKVSGDDSAIIMSARNAQLFATKGVDLMNEMGMYRKNMHANEPSRVIYDLEDVEFCSHKFSPVKVAGRVRWMPLRDTSEILAKANLMMAFNNDRVKEMAWARAQGLNLIVNYFHIPTVRMVALILLSTTPNNLVLTGMRKGWDLKNKPWIQEGNVMDIINTCLFGESTRYPSEHRISSMTELGYLPAYKRKKVDCNYRSEVYRHWKGNIPRIVRAIRISGFEYDDWIPSRMMGTAI